MAQIDREVPALRRKALAGLPNTQLQAGIEVLGRTLQNADH